MSKEKSPFSPGRPVDIEHFVGRAEELQVIGQAASQVAAGRNENLFITGERGIGKSSLAALTREIVRKDHGLVGAHCYLGRVRSLDEICATAFRALLEQLEPSLFEKVRQRVARYVTSLEAGVFGFGIRLRLAEDPRLMSELRLEFPERLREVYAQLATDCSGLLLILDDVNGATALPEFASFLKSVVDELATDPRGPLPLLSVLVGVPERMDELRAHHESVGRIFTPVQLRPVSQEESREFFERAFGTAGIEIEAGALQTLVSFGQGFPVFLHELGEAAYWTDEDNRVDEDDAISAVMTAAEWIGEKYLQRQVVQALRSETYRSLLGKISGRAIGSPVLRRREVLPSLSGVERKRFDNFLTRLKKLGVIKAGVRDGEYVFSTEMARLYFWLVAPPSRPVRD